MKKLLVILAAMALCTVGCNGGAGMDRKIAALRVKTIVAAEQAYRATYLRPACELKFLGPPAGESPGNLGDPLPQRKPGAAGLIDSILATGERDGYIYEVKCLQQDGRQAFVVTATPHDPTKRQFCADEAAVYYTDGAVCTGPSRLIVLDPAINEFLK